MWLLLLLGDIWDAGLVDRLDIWGRRDSEGQFRRSFVAVPTRDWRFEEGDGGRHCEDVTASRIVDRTVGREVSWTYPTWL